MIAQAKKNTSVRMDKIRSRLLCEMTNSSRFVSNANALLCNANQSPADVPGAAPGQDGGGVQPGAHDAGPARETRRHWIDGKKHRSALPVLLSMPGPIRDRPGRFPNQLPVHPNHHRQQRKQAYRQQVCGEPLRHHPEQRRHQTGAHIGAGHLDPDDGLGPVPAKAGGGGVDQTGIDGDSQRRRVSGQAFSAPPGSSVPDGHPPER